MYKAIIVKSYKLKEWTNRWNKLIYPSKRYGSTKYFQDLTRQKNLL